MRCARCGSDNPEGKRFCGDCGTPLAQCCPQCGAKNPADKKFCGDCGTSLIEKSPAGEPDSQTRLASAHPAGERRHLTVLFCDLVNSTALASRMDPEDWREAVAAYHRAATEAITRFGGYVAKYLGDGVMAFFGYPEAHDNDAERAVRAGLELLSALDKLNEDATLPKLAARIGIDSGGVVVGPGVGQDADVFGDTPNIAARVESAAEPNSILVSPGTHDLISGLFLVEDGGPRSLKGILEPLRLYRILQPSGARSRLEATATVRGLTPFVGRDDELRTLTHRWERVREGEGQVALIIGEAGIGKSRLVHRFHETLAGQSYLWIDAAAGALFQNSPFYPITEMLRRALFAGGSGPPDALAQIAGALSHAGVDARAAVPLLAPLLNLTLTSEYQSPPLPPEQQRRRLLATLVEWILGTARIQPLIIAIEDLHWADPSTLELIQLLVEQGSTAPLMLLYTARPEFRPPWPLRSNHAQINLNRLSARDVRTMVAQVAGQRALADETISAVVDRTGGVPLFVEELTRALLEHVDSRPTGREIPATLHDSLIARLDRLGPARETLQLGAVLGSEFSYELLYAVHPAHDHDELQRHLRMLTDAELLYVRGLAPDATYQFKHALIRDTAYEALLKSRRKELHQLVAQTIDSQFPTLKENQPEVLAHHWTEAGEIEPAIVQWDKAGHAAEARNAFIEALENYQQAAELFRLLPESPDRNNSELEVRTAIVRMLQITKGWTSNESAQAIEQAAELAEKHGNIRQLSRWMGSRAFAAWVSGNLSSALDLAERNHQLRLRLNAPTGLAYSHMLLLMTRFWIGELTAAEREYHQGLQFFDDRTFRNDPVGAAIAAFAYGSWTALILGYPDLARERVSLMRQATDERNLHELSFAGSHEVSVWTEMREYQRAEQLGARTLESSRRQRSVGAIARSQCALGDARAQSGRLSEGIASITEGLARLKDESPLKESYFMATLADAQRLEGKLTEALATADQALLTNPDQRPYRPEILRIRGAIHLALGQRGLAEADFRESISLAQSMVGKWWELRATTTLARLLRDTHRRDEAYSMLFSIYSWFTEGFDTADLKEAKALLDELNT